MEKPKVYNWFIGYCVLMCVLYLVVMGIGLMYPKIAEMAAEKQAEARIVGPLYFVFGLIFFLLFVVPFFLQPSPGVWVYDLVLICLGMTSCCTLPLTIPLLIFWIKPETKSYFGR